MPILTSQCLLALSSSTPPGGDAETPARPLYLQDLIPSASGMAPVSGIRTRSAANAWRTAQRMGRLEETLLKPARRPSGPAGPRQFSKRAMTKEYKRLEDVASMTP